MADGTGVFFLFCFVLFWYFKFWLCDYCEQRDEEVSVLFDFMTRMVTSNS